MSKCVAWQKATSIGLTSHFGKGRVDSLPAGRDVKRHSLRLSAPSAVNLNAEDAEVR
jgi:hypothetical protein